MSATLLGDGQKRKRSLSKQETAKKRRKSDSSDDDSEAQVLLLENEILESKKNYNNIAKLITFAKEYSENVHTAILSAVALCRVFIRLLAAGSLINKKGLSEKEAVVVRWLRDRLSEYKQILLAIVQDEDLAPTGLTLSMKLLNAEGRHLYDKDEYSFPKAFLESIVLALLKSGSTDARQEFVENFVDEYDDVRFYTLQSIKNIVVGQPEIVRDDKVFNTVFDLLISVDGIPGSNDELEDFFLERPKKGHSLLSLLQHKKQGQDAWLALMKQATTKDQRKKILGRLTTDIAPWFVKPELLADFLTDSYNTGGSLSLLALSGVFYLIEERNLDYPSFYPKLYSLLDRDILHSKHRSRFFRLLDTFLASTHLPAALVASFIKRVSRLALYAPPSAIVVVFPWIYNLLKQHPLCTFMIHREIRDPQIQKTIEMEGLEDPFDMDEKDPMETSAIDSCLWELVHLQSHYHPNVATIAKIISEQFTKNTYNMEDFLDHSYASLLEAEMTKEIKKAPVVEFRIPKRIFLPQDAGAEEPDSLLVKLWRFE